MFESKRLRKVYIKEEVMSAKSEGKVTCLGCKNARVYPNISNSFVSEAFCKVKQEDVKCYNRNCDYYKSKFR